MSQGADLTYSGIHYRLKSERGPAKDYACVQCGGRAADWAYDNIDASALIDPDRGVSYSLNTSHYLPMCRTCHRRFDNAVAGRAACGTDAGYYRHRRQDTEPCAGCKEAHTRSTRSRLGLPADAAPRTHCKHGHEFTPENTHIDRQGWRNCRACGRAKSARQRAAREAVA